MLLYMSRNILVRENRWEMMPSLGRPKSTRLKTKIPRNNTQTSKCLRQLVHRLLALLISSASRSKQQLRPQLRHPSQRYLRSSAQPPKRTCSSLSMIVNEIYPGTRPGDRLLPGPEQMPETPGIPEMPEMSEMPAIPVIPAMIIIKTDIRLNDQGPA